RHEVAALFVKGVSGRCKLLEIGQGLEGQPGQQGTDNVQALGVRLSPGYSISSQRWGFTPGK
ncbi:MAG: hypothetical protein PWQ81_516, partial [Bacteroidota bacterium]|nr:hypothetical protein [Bacteroidota bacterium]